MTPYERAVSVITESTARTPSTVLSGTVRQARTPDGDARLPSSSVVSRTQPLAITTIFMVRDAGGEMVAGVDIAVHAGRTSVESVRHGLPHLRAAVAGVEDDVRITGPARASARGSGTRRSSSSRR